ncbi:acetate/propionate family kinase [Ligilactobacillus ceti]|uniref:Acetate kinase n=1 Tax=Ligilactobacillus ceti DSM 22408 TaxID=1122146 RepID=A0A0R2KQM3_9LACO|nr:acetate kinase [Ligilactobacillus ceti]KRN88500.1 acetate kinase [Ligilactobacillus ceti DSM 22408]
MEKIIAINSGSSSLKFKLFLMPEEKVLASGLIERIGIKDPRVEIKYGDGQVFEKVGDIPDHKTAVSLLMDLLLELKIIDDYSEITGVGHRVVAGGEYFKHSEIVTPTVIEHIREIFEYAPLHNPANLVGIEAFKKILPDACSVVVFDTAFHQTIPEENYLYSVPFEWYEDYKVRRYGAHGTSHRYVSDLAAKMMGKPLEDLKLISCHLGAGASICAVKGGESFDTSMGFTPLTGVTMATRSGDVDVALVAFMMKKLNLDMDEMMKVLNGASGLQGISGISSDMRDIDAARKTDKRAELAMDIFVKNVVKYIGEYTFEMGGVDGIIFTAGIGENAITARTKIMERLAFMGIEIDHENNQKRGAQNFISTKDSKVQVMCIPTDEELMIARDVQTLAQEDQA